MKLYAVVYIYPLGDERAWEDDTLYGVNVEAVCTTKEKAEEIEKETNIGIGCLRTIEINSDENINEVINKVAFNVAENWD